MCQSAFKAQDGEWFNAISFIKKANLRFISTSPAWPRFEGLYSAPVRRPEWPVASDKPGALGMHATAPIRLLRAKGSPPQPPLSRSLKLVVCGKRGKRGKWISQVDTSSMQLSGLA